jgi:hypothetical protein
LLPSGRFDSVFAGLEDPDAVVRADRKVGGKAEAMPHELCVRTSFRISFGTGQTPSLNVFVERGGKIHFYAGRQAG